MTQISKKKIETLLEQANSTDSENSSVAEAARSFATESEAREAFSYLHKKLFSIKRWDEKSLITGFELYDANGVEKPDKNAVTGDFIKTVLPGSGKNDWVKIIEIYEVSDEVVLTVQPSNDPTAKTEKEVTSHFFTADSTNNFCLQRTGAKINFYVIGLREKSNVEDTGGVLESVRNVAAANLGRFLGIQKTQWETFCANFIKIEE